MKFWALMQCDLYYLCEALFLFARIGTAILGTYAMCFVLFLCSFVGTIGIVINTSCFTSFYNFKHKQIMANRELRQFQTQINSNFHYGRANKGFNTTQNYGNFI